MKASDEIDLPLRQRAREGRADVKKRARAELRRRRDNLRGGLIPSWEQAARGPDLTRWRLW